MTQQMHRATLGVVAICKNEEKDLPGFLRHLLPWVNEVILVDDGSTDRTLDIANAGEPKVKIISDPRQPGEYYSHQRNKGIDAATSDWLLHMDIDERVTPELAQEILQAITDGTKDAYQFRRLDFFLHHPMRSLGHWQLHLARRTEFRFVRKIHETLDAPAERIGRLNARMWHLNDDSYRERMRKSDTYCQIEAEDILESGHRIRWYDFVLFPLRRFFRQYVLKRGYRDGVPGLIFYFHSVTAAFRSCALVWDEQNRIPRGQLEGKIADLWQSSEPIVRTEAAETTHHNS